MLLIPLLCASAAAAKRETADHAYEGARRAYYTLKADPARRKLRHHWLNVAEKFSQVAKDYPKSDRAPEALFTAGELLNELSRISLVDDDLQGAIHAYERLVQAHPRHRLADDAALALARIQLDRLERPEAARKLATDALAQAPRGDQAHALRALLASLPAAPAPTHRERAVAEAKPAPHAPAEAKVASKAKVSSAAKVIEVKLSESKPSAPKASETQVAEARAADTKSADAKAIDAKPADAKPAEAVPELEVANVSDARAGTGVIEAISRLARDPVLAPPSASRAPAEAPAPRAQPVVLQAKPAAQAPAPLAAVDGATARARLKAVARNSREAELTLAEQLGLKVRRVVIDAGHGGHDTGAIGKGGTREKDVSLAVAQRLAAVLTERGLEVILTRDGDRFVRLEDRARFANEAKGDLFISVHCNSAVNRKLRGVETYTLNTSADRYSIRLAARENASSEKSISDLQFILADLATKANTEESTRLATQVQKSLVGQLAQRHAGIKDLGHKEALFYVLLGVKMPAILVETSFLSHPEEEKLLASPAYQQEVALAIARGVEGFLNNRNELAKVD
nr:MULTISPECIES: N-acetylmuramoyl-L-alanine amidase [Myxococcaceae]